MLEAVRYVHRHPKCKMIMDYHADYSNSAKNWISLKILHGILRRRILTRARPYLSAIFPIVPGSADFLREVYGVPADEMELLPLGADLEYSRATQASGVGAQLRATLGIPPEAFVIFTGGKLGPLKGTEHLIAAIRSIQDPRVRLLVIGKPEPGREAYGEVLHQAAGADSRILFRGWLNKEDVYAHLDASDLAVFPSSQSVLWQQAIGMDLPLILSEMSPLARAFQDVSYLNPHGNVIVLDPYQPFVDQLAIHIRRLLSDPALCRQMAAGARRTAEEVLDWNKLIHRTLKVCQEGAASSEQGERNLTAR